MNTSPTRHHRAARSNHPAGAVLPSRARRALGLVMLGSGLVWLNVAFHHALGDGSSPLSIATWLEHGFGAIPTGDAALALLLCGMLAAYAIRRAR
jgi:hypothetical protein